MKKTLILVGMLSIGYARAQEGKVGINTHTPSATLDVSPSAANAVATATTNEGILAPRLSKARIANIATPVEGTLVYATDNVYLGNSPRVVKITEKGYYYYNGTEWVKAGDTKTILSGTTVPATGTGSVGDFYINTTTNTIYGPKTASGWGTGVSLVGPVGPQGAQGLQGVAGPAGARGATGATGPQGPQGIAGAAGAKGADGKSVLSGTTVPATGTGSVGDFYINTTTNTIYGPKTASGWGTGVSLVGPAGPQGAQGLQGVAGPAGARGATGATGPQGPQGIAGAAGAKGADGKSVLSGTTVPATGTGSVGDFYINTTTNTIYGPKTASGWGTGVSLVGPVGPQGAQGLQGVAGPAGARGATGATGPQGPQGIAGAAGAKGADGKSVLSGTTVPATGTGSVGDFYINTTTNTIYGPKTASGWGTGVSLVGPVGPQGAQGLQGVAGPAGARGATGATGPQGPQGIAGAAGVKGADGKSVLSGTTVPATGTGSVGDFYINTTTNTIYGPKTASGWGTGVSLVGPAGPQGAQGLQGVAGPAGARGATGATGPQGPQGIAGAAGARGPEGPSGIVTASRGLIYTANTKDIALPAGTANNQVLKWNGTAWAPAVDTDTNTTYTAGTGLTLTGTVFSHAAHTGDVTGTTALTIANNAVNSAKIADNSVATADLANGAVTAVKLNQMGATNGQVLKWNGTAWAPAADTNDNIYTANGTLSGNRTVTQGTNNLMFTGEGKVGFGTATPRAKVDIVGGVRASKGDAVGDGANVGYAFEGDGDTGMFAIGGAAVNGSDLILKNDNVQALTIKTGTRNVGIGTNDPGQKLEVAGGNIRAIGGLMSLGNTNIGGWLELENTLKTGETEGSRWRIYNMTDKTSGGTVQYTPGLHFWAYSTSATQSNLGSKMMLTDEGNLGIGLGSRGVPTAMLDVSGATRIRDLAGTGDRPVAVAADGTLKVGATLQNLQGSTSVAITNNQIQRAALTGDVTAAANSNALTIANNAVTSAKIADGTIVNADLANNAVTGAKIANATITADKLAAGVIPTDTNTNIYNTDGTLTAVRTVDTGNHNLNIKGNSWYPLIVNSTFADNGNSGGIAIHPNDFTKRVEVSTTTDGDFRFWAGTNRMYIKRNTGNVGIGTAEPTEKLDVAGSIKSTALAGTGNRNVMADENGKLVIGETQGNKNMIPTDTQSADVEVGQMIMTTISCTDGRQGWVLAMFDGYFYVCTRNTAGKSVWLMTTPPFDPKYYKNSGHIEYFALGGRPLGNVPAAGYRDVDYGGWAIRIK